MSSSQRALVSSVPVLLCSGCNAAFWGNVGVLCVTVGIFLGTVFLGRGEARARAQQSNGGAETTSR